VHRGSQGGTQVGGARSDVTEVLVVSEFGDSLNVGSSSAQSIENFGDSSTWLHGNNTELIFFIDPNEESLGIVVENTSARRPITIEVASLEETITLLEQEMILNELILGSFVHSLQGVELTLQITFESFACFHN
jgi:hypothetical protein